MATLQVVDGKREELQRKLIECIFTPGPTPKEFEEILKNLERRANLTVAHCPHGTIQAER